MARRRKKRKPRIPPEEVVDPEGLAAWMLRFLEDLRVRNYAQATVEGREAYLAVFLGWCRDRDLGRPHEVTRPILQRYQRHLFYHRKADGNPLSFRSQHNRMAPVLAFFKWLTRQNVLLYNPASELDLPKLERRLPRSVLSAEEAEKVLGQANVGDPFGIRDRAILETFYSTGMRRREVCELKVFDLDAERGTVIVRLGKGKKDRMIPIGERAVAWCNLYLQEVRPELATEPDDGTLFLVESGESISPGRMTQLVATYIDLADIGKRGSCHLFRHTMATIMLENGADVRFIQEMLGHAQLTSTQIYTQVAIKKLQEIHAATHPSSKLGRPGSEPEVLDVEAELAGGDDSLGN